jgi:mycothiol synthase
VSRVEVRRQLTPADVAAASALLETASHADGWAAFGEGQWVELEHGGGRGVVGLFGFSAGGDLVGYGHLTRDAAGWSMEYTIDPAWRSTPDLAAALIAAAVGVVADEGGGPMKLWRSHPTAESDALAAAVGLQPTRDLLQLRRPLPVGEAWDVAVRAFVPGRDEEAWLEVNNRAFAWHPEQGNWDLATLKGREALPWFDPAGFLLHEEGGRLAGFCWTKGHDDTMGEIYVIAVDPDFAGRGLGRELTLAGLDHLAGRGLTVGMLYVDGTNVAARALYDRLGFTTDHVDRVYAGEIGGA